MVRTRSKPAAGLDGIRQVLLTRQTRSPVKNTVKKKADSKGHIKKDTPQSPVRSSKRTKKPFSRYEPTDTEPVLTKSKASSIAIQTTPKRKSKVVSIPKRPSKTLKRLKKTPVISKNDSPTKSTVRRKLLKSPSPAALPSLRTSTSRKRKSEGKQQPAKTVQDPSPKNVSKRQKVGKDETDKIKTPKSKSKKGKLSPKPDLTCYEKEPTFESKDEVPFISTVAHSRLLIRAVILNDLKLLKKLLHTDTAKICSLRIARSTTNKENVLDYVFKHENIEAFKLLHKIPAKTLEKLGSSPSILISEEGTGRGSHLMFGHALRQVSVGRGGKEGNNAFLYDRNSAYSQSQELTFVGYDLVTRAVKAGASMEFIELLMREISMKNLDFYNLHEVLRMGQYKLVGQTIEKEGQKGYGFNLLHAEALTKTNGNLLTPFKPVSVTKKCTYDPRFTPLHCAAINPNVSVLMALLRAMPDFNLADAHGWTVGHYAAVCCSPEPLKYLLQYGISIHATTSMKRSGDGYTLLHAAVSAGRTDNVKVILEHEEKSANDNMALIPDDDEDSQKKQKVGLIHNDIKYKLTTKGKNPLHMACELGHVEIVKLLLTAGTDGNRPNPAKYDRTTPLMIASMYGHLDVVKVLVEAEVKVDAKDKRGRTACHHAAMNGHTHVLSYLLRLGANHLALDSSGNTLLHYSSAYGWYFATMLLLEAGCPPNTPNQWKMTPMAIAFMKGHTGLVVELMKQEGVDVNAKIDENGRTLFLETCKAGLDFSGMKFLVDELKADPACEDFNGNNALHYMATKQIYTYSHDYYKKDIQSLKDCIKYLIQQGCNTGKFNSEGSTPILLAAKLKNFNFIAEFIVNKVPFNFEKDSEGNTLLHHMSTTFTEAENVVHTIFDKLCGDPATVPVLKQMTSTYNKSGYTPLLLLLNSLTSLNDTNKPKVLNVVTKLLGKLDADVNATVKGENPLTALHLAVGTAVLEKILKYKPSLEVTDETSQTPLILAVLGGHHESAEKLISAGANVNVKVKSEFNIGLPLLLAMKEAKSFSLIPKLIANGAITNEIHPKTKNSMLHYIARKATVLHAATALQAVLDAGTNPNSVNSDGRSPLHLAVNSRGSETDVFYDIEDILTSNGADPTIKDHRGRIPLHYAFVKIGSPTNSTFFDPIELVSQLVNSMQHVGATSHIYTTDVYGSSPLHYAAFRGATICCSYLIQTVKNIDICDNNGNTPFGLAVRNEHEGCALNFYQKDADFLRTLNNNIKIQELQTEQASISNSLQKKKTVGQNEVWKCSYVQREEEEKQILHEELERYPILEQVVKHNWQGMLYLMVGQLQSNGIGFSTGIATALKTNRLKLALKLALKVKRKEELSIESGTLFHTLAKYYDGKDDDLIVKIAETIRKCGVNTSDTDEFKSHPVIYALINNQHKLCETLVPRGPSLMPYLSTLDPDLFGRTLFNALFWKMERQIPHNMPLQNFAEQLLSFGANPNQLCEYPFHLSSCPGVRKIQKLVDIVPSNGPRFTPLITAVIFQCYITVKWLLNIKIDGAPEVNINAQDSEGLTAIMHAVRLNDTKMVKLLLDPVNYSYVKDLDGKTLPKSRSSKIDFSIRDKEGLTVMDHLLLSPGNNCYYKNIKQIFKMLQTYKATDVTSADGLAPVDRAIKVKRPDTVDLFSIQLPQVKKTLQMWNEYEAFHLASSQSPELSPVENFAVDAAKMAEKLMEEERQKRKEKGEDETVKALPDPLCGLDKDNSELIMDKERNIPYDCLMTKVDLSYGMYGLYNFYKMQLIKQPRGKEMILLFTQWGRVGTSGQFQKTPFATEEEAIKEFCKIFRSKSGNAWETVQSFIPHPAKYRLVVKDLRQGKHSTEAKVNFAALQNAGKSIKSRLPHGVTSLIKALCLIHENADGSYNNPRHSYYNQMNANYGSLPFLPHETLVQGDNLLKKVGELIEKKLEMDRDTKGKYEETDKLEVVNEIVKRSEEFYAIIPVFGYSTEKLEPIFEEQNLRQKIIDISRLLHLGLAKSLLLAAQHHQEKENPFDYIYRCLGSQMQLLDRFDPADNEETDLILQYIHNTGENVKVHGIFRVAIPTEEARLNATNIQNRQLLWHGTSAANMLSILHQGLQVAPLSAQISGALFGKGIYLADMFSKSQGYCRSVDVNGKTRKYMLLCEAALGKIWQVKLSDASEKEMPAGYDSLKTADSRYEPDPETTIFWKGRTVALGQKKEKYYKESWGWGLDYNEYIVYNVDQVAVRYLVEFEE